METKAKSKKLGDLKSFLVVEKERLQKEIEQGVLTTDDERAGYSNHMADDANVVFEQARNVGLKRGHELLLGEVEDALQRIADGSYGVCRRCGEPIDSARLKALPTAALCISCQEYRETR